MRKISTFLVIALVGCSSSGDAPVDDGVPDAIGELPDVADDAAPSDADDAFVVPTIDASIDPAAPTRATGVTAKVHLSPSPGWTSHFRWKGPRSVADDQAKNNAIQKGESWTLEAWAIGPEGARVDAKPVSFVVGNTLPGAPSVSIAPASPTHGDALVAKLVADATDADADALALDWAWDRDGMATTYTTPDVPSGVIVGKESWRVRVRAHEVSDATQVGPEASATVVVGLAPPTAPVVAIEPAAPSVGDALSAKIVTAATDPKGEALTYAYAWLRDGVPTTLTTETIAGSEVGAHQVFRLEVRAKNSGVFGPPGIATATVNNRAPNIDTVTLTPVAPTGSSVISAAWTASDPDGDALTTSFRWLKGGIEIAGVTTATLPAGSVKRGDVVTCEVTVTDSYGAKATRTSAPVTIANATPSSPNALRFNPPYPRGTETSSIVASATDADGDAVSYVVEWTLDEVPQPTVKGLALTNAQLARGVWTARVAATDGTSTSAFVEVPGAVTLCPAKVLAPITSTAGYGSKGEALWDARSCSYLFASNINTWDSASAQSFDPVTFESLAAPNIPFDSEPRSWNPRAFLAPKVNLQLTKGTVDMGYSYLYSASIHRESWAPYSRTVDLPPYPYLSGDIVAKASDYDTTNGIRTFALLDAQTVAKTRVLSLITQTFPDYFVATPTTTTVTVSSGTTFPDARHTPSAYHPASQELLIGPVSVGGDYAILGVHVKTGVARTIASWSGLKPTDWRYEHWTRTFVTLVPYADSGVGRLDPVTGAVTWTKPTKGFGLPTYSPTTTWDKLVDGPAARNPNTGDMAVPVGGTGIVQYRAADSALRDATGPLPYSAWVDSAYSPTDRPSEYDTIARTAKGTVLIVPMHAFYGQVSMSRIFELDPATGAITWLAPSADSDLPDWLRFPSVAYDPSGDALYLHGGDYDNYGPTRGDTWRFDLTTHKWKKLTSTGPARVYGSLAFDASKKRLLYFGGVTGPLWPEPTWRGEIWSLDLATNAWSLLDSSGPSYRAATISVDSTGTKMYVLGYRYYWTSDPPSAHVMSFDFGTKTWLSESNVRMASSPMSYISGPDPYFKQMLPRGAPSKRAFVFGGRACTDLATNGEDSGLLSLSWDNPTAGWTYAVRDTASTLGYPSTSWDDSRNRAFSLWSREFSATCLAPRAGSNANELFSWP